MPTPRISSRTWQAPRVSSLSEVRRLRTLCHSFSLSYVAQIIATRGSKPLDPRARASWGGNAHFEYWFPRPAKTSEDVSAPLIILGGGRECCPAESPGDDDGDWKGKEKWGYEVGIADDSRVNEKVGKALRSFLPGVFPGMYAISVIFEIQYAR